MSQPADSSQPVDSTAPWILKSVASKGVPERIPVDDKGVTFGRAPRNNIVLAESTYPQVSAHHARLICDDQGRLHVTDLGSRNGTFVNDHPVQDQRLRDGDILQLGPGGPKFVCERAERAAVTAFIDVPKKLQPRPKEEMGKSTVFRVKKALGLDEHADVGQMVQQSERSRRRLGIAVVVGMVAVVAIVWVVRSFQQDEINQLIAANKELRSRLEQTSGRFEGQRLEWETQRTALQKERQGLIKQIASRDQASSSELKQLKSQLDATEAKLQRYDPLNLEKARQLRVGRIQRAVVFVETKIRYRSAESGQLLRVNRNGPGGEIMFDVAESGEAFERESSGSGFCIRTDGSIVTNGHVVQPEGFDEEIKMDENTTLRPEPSYAAVFSGTDKRHPAKVIKVMYDGDDDLALLRIEPFEGMPYLTEFKTTTPAPPTGADVYIHGFPLGKRAVQEGDRVIASSFRGILSRTVSNWLQVDAAVHPGNSGGPLTDAAGNVIGVVCRVQRIDDEAIAPDMGYAIPLKSVARLLEDK